MLKPKLRSRKIFPLYPLFLASFPVLSIYYRNISEVFSFTFLTPLAIALVISVLIFFVFKLVLGDLYKAGLMAAFAVLVIFSHGHLHNIIGGVFPNTFNNGAHEFFGLIPLGIDDILFSIWGMLFLIFFLLVYRTRRNFFPVTKFLNFTAAFLLAVPFFSIGVYEISHLNTRILNGGKSVAEDGVSFNIDRNADKPDIYYIILDRYASNSTLKNFYGYDNSRFLDFLKDRGFYVAEESTANYPRTLFSLASSLNMEYINYLTALAGEETDDHTFAYPLIERHTVGDSLKSLGYTYLHLGSWFEPTKAVLIADQNFLMGDLYLGLDGFSTEVLNTTIFAPLIRKIFPETSTGNFNTQHANRILYQFNQLKKITPTPGPKFVMAHILIPHPPFVFDADCNIEPGGGKTAGDSSIEGYVDQMICGNTMVEEMVEDILNNSPSDPVIIIQADEGPYARKYPMPPGRFNFKDASDNTLKERFGILNALYLPKADRSEFYPSMTPVNTFRTLFRNYFGANLENLPDRNYIYEDEDHLYKYIDVTDRLRN